METEGKEPFTSRSPPTLPEDIIFYQIFPRLPVKSIHRFRCVSTSCHRLLTSDRYFLSAIRLHARSRYFLSFSTAMHWQLALYSLDRTGAASAIHVDDGYPQNPSDYCTYAKLVNGLMFTVHGVYEAPIVSISNTATNEKLQLPSFPEPSRKDRMYFYFCHDPEKDRYKVLRTMAVRAYTNGNDAVMKYSVFTLGAQTSWRDYSLPNLHQTGNSKSVCINGTLYCTKFRRTDGDRDTSVIGAFALKNKHFYAVKYPNGLPLSRYNLCHLIEVQGALAIVDVQGFGCREMRLWIKEKGRFRFGDESWTEHRIVFDPRWETTYGSLLSYSFSTSLDGKIVMGSTGLRSSNGCWIFIYNMERREWRRVEIKGLDDRMILGDLSVDEYVESPLSLRQMLNM